MLTNRYLGHLPADGPHIFVREKMSAVGGRKRGETLVRPRVLTVECRDEVYAKLKALLDDECCDVARAELGATVASALRQFAPDLILVNGEMPDESGWLIACKMRLRRCLQPVWLYAARPRRLPAAWKDLSGVDKLIQYDGVLPQLLQSIKQNMSAWLHGRIEHRP